MNNLAATSDSLADMAKQIAERLLWKRLQHNAKSYAKVDFNILEQGPFFTIQVTICTYSSPSLKVLLSNVFNDQLESQNPHDGVVVAIVQEKSVNAINVRKVVYSQNCLQFSLLTDQQLLQVQKEFSSLKHYVSIQLLFQVQNVFLEKFSSCILSHIKQIELIDPNVKFLFRKGSYHIYRNRVQMDDIVLSCSILNSACTDIFQNSRDEGFRKDLMDILGIKKKRVFEQTVGCLLLAKANNNFSWPSISSKSKN